ncbi:EamA family transporter [uncultured Dialister sp.]|uniref:EamA family transporter n=1 Tax=uncultured Dialister sp. TaxID=278064 RepID=UPI00266FEAC9|nr:DMT family transporter [uncultured Dialister sp.]
MHKGFYALIVFSAGACYGVLSTFVKMAYAAGLTLTDVSGMQCLFGMLFLWLAALFTVKRRPSPFQILSLAAIGIPMALTTIFYYHSLETLSASMAVVFLFQSIWMGTAAESLIFRKLPGKKQLLSILFCLSGTFLAAGLAEEGTHFSLSSGMVWGILSALSYTVMMTASSLLGKGIPPALKGALMSTGDTVLTFILLPPLFLWDASSWPLLMPFGLILGIFGVALPPFLLAWGMPQVGPGLGTILAASELPVALLMALMVLGESVTPVQWIGILMIGAGMVVGNIKNGKGL